MQSAGLRRWPRYLRSGSCPPPSDLRRVRIIRCRSIALRTVRATLALLMLVSVISIAPHRTPPAFAGGTTFYVSPVGAAAYADATDPTEPVTGCTSLATACSDVRAGDTVFHPARRLYEIVELLDHQAPERRDHDVSRLRDVPTHHHQRCRGRLQRHTCDAGADAGRPDDERYELPSHRGARG